MKNNGYAGKSHAHKNKKEESKKNPKGEDEGISWKVEGAPGDRYVCTVEAGGQQREEWFNEYHKAVEFGTTVETLYNLEKKK